MNILVLCTGNSARSILLEHILKDLGFSTFSAGSNPTGKVHPQAIKLLKEEGFDTVNARSKSWDEFAAPDSPVMDAVITVCGSAAGEECPIWPGAPITVHWGVDDPAAADETEWEDAFRLAFIILKKRADAFVNVDANLSLRERLHLVSNLT